MSNLILKAILGIDGSGYENGLKRAESQASKFSKNVAGHFKSQIAGAFGVAAIEETFRRAIEWSGKMADASDKYGASLGKLQEYDYAGGQTGASVEEFGVALKKLRAAQLQAKRGDEEMINDFARFGVTIDDIRNKDAESIFDKMARNIAELGLEGDRAAIALKILGKSGDAIFPALKAGLDAAAQDLKDFNLIISDESIQALDKFGDHADLLFRGIRKAAAESAGSLLDEFEFAGTQINLLLAGAFAAIHKDRNQNGGLASEYFAQFFANGDKDNLAAEANAEKLAAQLKKKADAKRAANTPKEETPDEKKKREEAVKISNSVYEAATKLSLRNTPSNIEEMRKIRELRLQADELDTPDASTLDRAKMNEFRMDALKRAQALQNPFPMQMSLNHLQQSGLQRILSPEQSDLNRTTRELVSELRQLRAQLIRGGVPLPQLNQLTF